MMQCPKCQTIFQRRNLKKTKITKNGQSKNSKPFYDPSKSIMGQSWGYQFLAIGIAMILAPILFCIFLFWLAISITTKR
jgi:hypothetical protein